MIFSQAEQCILHGCGPSSVAVVASGYGIDKDPGDVADMMDKKVTNETTLCKVLDKLGISNEAGRKSGEAKKSEIRDHLKKGLPVLIGTDSSNPGADTRYGSEHWVVGLAVDNNDNITLSNVGRNDSDKEAHTGTVDELIGVYAVNCWYILITEPLPTTSVSSGGDGQVTQTSTSSETGYTGIYKSGTTGREFKEYKQTISDWDSKYPVTNTYWGQECGTVSVMIIGSGYTKKATFEDTTSKLNKSGGSSYLESWLSEYTGQSINMPGRNKSNVMSKESFKTAMSQGGVAMIHSSSYSAAGHYMAILDINKDKTKVYLSNPVENTDISGWITIEQLYDMVDEITMVTNDGSAPSYGNSAGVTSLDNFLFIGDSRTVGLKSYIKKEGNNISVQGAGATSPYYWTNWINDEVHVNPFAEDDREQDVKLPPKSEVKGVSVDLGVNDPTQIEYMKTVLEKLLARYPNTPIFVNRVFYVGSNFNSYNSVFQSPSNMNKLIDEFNSAMQAFCNTNSNLYYIDATEGLHDGNFLSSKYSSDGIHLLWGSGGYELQAQNIKNAILNAGATSSNGGFGYMNFSTNISKYIVKKEGGGYKYDIDLDEKVEEIYEILKEQDNKDLGKYLDSADQKEYLKMMIKAELVTQFPDLRTVDEIEADRDNAEVMENLDDKVKEVIKELKPILDTRRIRIKDMDGYFESQAARDEAVEKILEGKEYTTKTEEDVSITSYYYTEEGIDYVLEKTGLNSFYVYQIIKEEEISEVNRYVYESLQIDDTQDKICEIIKSGEISENKSSEYFGATAERLYKVKGYNKDEVITLYYDYTKKIYDELKSKEDTEGKKGFGSFLLDFFKKKQEERKNKLSTKQDNKEENESEDNKDSDEELQGIVKIIRKIVDKQENGTIQISEKILTYMPYEDFSKKIEKNEKDALYYFSINSTGEVVVATWESRASTAEVKESDDKTKIPKEMKEPKYEDTGGNKVMRETSLSYIPSIYQHIMSFELLWTLLVYSGDRDFVYSLADLASNGTIEITALDKITIKDSSYVQEFSTKEAVVANSDLGSIDINDASENTINPNGDLVYNHKIVYSDYHVSNTVELKVTKIDSWVAKYTDDTATLKEQPEDNEAEEIETTEGEKDWVKGSSVVMNSHEMFVEKYGEEYVRSKKDIIIRYIKKSLEHTIFNGSKDLDFYNDNILNAYFEDLVDGEIIQNAMLGKNTGLTKLSNKTEKEINKLTNDRQIRENIKDVYLNLSKNEDWGISEYTKIGESITLETTSTTEYEYEETSGKLELKTDIGGGIDNFVELLYHHGRAYDNLNTIASWMYKSMENNQVICDKIDLMKYLIRVTYQSVEEIEEELRQKVFDLFDPDYFKQASSSNLNIHGKDVQEKIWNALIDAGYSEYAVARSNGEYRM